MVRWFRIYVSERAKEVLEEYAMHNGSNFNSTIWHLIDHERYCSRPLHYKRVKEIANSISDGIKQPKLDSFGREVNTDSEKFQDSTKEESKS